MSDVEPLFLSPRLPYRRQRASPSNVTQIEIAASSFSAISVRISLRTWPTASFSWASVTGAWPGAAGGAGAAVVADGAGGGSRLLRGLLRRHLALEGVDILLGEDALANQKLEE